MTVPITRTAQLVCLLAVSTAVPGGDLDLKQPYSIDVLTGDDVKQGPKYDRNIGDLINRVPGVTTQSGESAAGSNVSIRGLDRLGGRASPLVLVDGRRVGGGFSLSGNTQPFDISSIPPDQIERIEVINGVAATAIYGHAAVAGIINIKLKKDRPGTDGAGSTDALAGDSVTPFTSGYGGYGFESGGPITPVTPALGIYDAFANHFTGSIDNNQLCDFGAAQLQPGWTLSPWIDGGKYVKDGYDYYIPFDQPANGTPADGAANGAETPSANGAPDMPADGAPANGAANSPAPDAPPNGSANDAGGTPANGASPDTPADPADGNPGSSAGNGGDTGASPGNTGPAAAPPTTALQRWDRGVPPWSLVMNSPEVAHLVEQLKPYYQLRFDKRAEMSELGYWGLSPTELADNKAEYDAAREIWKGTRREILTLLGPYMDPAVAAAATTGDPSWSDGPGPVLPPDIFGGDAPVTHPSQTAAAKPPAAEPAAAGTAATRPAPDAGDEDRIDYKIGLSSSYGDLDLGGGYRIKGDFSEYFRPGTGVPADGIKVDVQPYLVTPETQADGSEQLVPAAGALFSPNYPYPRKLWMPRKGGLRDAEFNSDLGSLRGAANATTGKIEYGLPGATIDDYVRPDSSYHFDWDEKITPSLGHSYSLPQGDVTPPTSSYSQYAGRYADYDSRFALRQEAARKYYDWDTDKWSLGSLRESLNREWSQRPDFKFDPSIYRYGYNLDSGQGAVSIPLYRYEAETLKLGGDGNTAPDASAINPEWRPYVSGRWSLNDDHYLNFRWAEGARPPGNPLLGDATNILGKENDFCATEAFPANGALTSIINGTRMDDDWFLQRVGLATPPTAAASNPVIVAVIDTGLDYHHYDLSWDNLWFNPGELPDNGIDDDNNGFIDDIIGWDFTEHTNTPWDHDGHGTFITGLIAADTTNRAGIDGINPAARIMVLKALNNFGHTRASWLAQAIKYAADNGARIINLSAAGPGLPQFVQDAVDYADSRGVLVVVAAGNSAENVDGVGPAGLDKVITVAATGLDDHRAVFSNWGERIDIAAPGQHIKSLRARQTDFRLTSADTPYQRGTAILGADRRYYRADGTSFAAPLVTGAASLLWSARPELTHTQVRRMLEQSARDIDTPGRDQFTGYGLLDASAALAADPEYFTIAAIDAVAVAVVDGRQVARVTGSSDADAFGTAYVELGAGESPQKWKRIGKPLKKPVIDGVLADIPAGELQGQSQWTIRIVTEHDNRSQREAWYRLNIN